MEERTKLQDPDSFRRNRKKRIEEKLKSGEANVITVERAHRNELP